LALEAIRDTARALAAGIVSVLNLLNLQAAVLGGDLLLLGELLLDPVNRFVSASVLTAAGAPGRQWVYAARTRGQPALAGGARLLLDQLLFPETACR
jgi:predicted NBD/HSP70 family sugar kinase